MSAVAIAGGMFVCCIGAAVLGTRLRIRLPSNHLSDDSRDVIKLVMGLVATMSALVLGLLIASSKSFYDNQTAEIQALSAKIVALDFVLAQYGPEAAPVRAAVRQAVEAGEQRVRTGFGETAAIAAHLPSPTTGLARLLRELAPRNDAQRTLQNEALRQLSDIGVARLLMVEQIGNPLDWPFLMILMLWIGVLFLGFGLFTTLNTTVFSAILLGSLSASSAIFLILEMSMPYQGLIHVSSAPLQHALLQIGQ
jgi:hypothetical protein